MKRALEEAGVTVLRNEALRFDPHGHAPLYIAGIDAHVPRVDNASRALALVPSSAARVVIMHNPARSRSCRPTAHRWRSLPIRTVARCVCHSSRTGRGGHWRRTVRPMPAAGSMSTVSRETIST
jgi:hypothetical protein